MSLLSIACMHTFFKDHLGTISEAHPWSRLIFLSQESLVFCSSLSRGEAL